ncbi:conjugal transfer protein TraM [Campylobacter canadensis]|uniref:Conjugal transfer protein TraM n=1 Tax=Campylobacter canadensis TaxID=449520 RepID=A0ABS7WT58_9BACT|nr:conjugal transfer protein TraM [Campylobacter canadensis]MBZ7987963.1 conjugal transfer protein TraM [Campylobacter canadensis]MBZ7997042.1 conjugal transfer protein TraM [Campylobacter canadensis]MBZ7998917.1 conjugal transfer protein TraM [Campylobacter canadensis]MBZ8000589.1 conjugal transfer protein TraM [Campylobacter canadensis]MBZ8002325.1 conjugal transfer protein TraM [Campylobacter canadensis]
MDKKQIINEIAKKHHLILDENDPIFAIITANEIMFDDYIKQLEKAQIKIKADLESYKQSLISDIQEEYKKYHQVLQELKLNQVTNLKSNQLQNEKNIDFNKKNIFTAFIIAQIIFLLIGLIIGILL